MSAIAGASRALATKLQEWLGSAEAPPTQGPSGIGPVTARTPAEAAAPRDLPALLVLLGILSAGAAFLAGFDFWRGLDLFAAAFLGAMAMRWPAMTAREPRTAKAGGSTTERRAA